MKEGERHARDILDDGFKNVLLTDSHTNKKGRYSHIAVTPCFYWRARRDSNPRPTDPEKRPFGLPNLFKTLKKYFSNLKI